jgi:aminoglycoside phosphotransferase (APT) family kinase protein
MATVGDPLLDLGWVVQGWPREGDDHSKSGYVPMEGMPSRTELLEYYTEVSGRPTDEIEYYEILAGFKLAIVLEGQYSRFTHGSLDNPKIEAFGAIVPDLLQKAAALARSADR